MCGIGAIIDLSGSVDTIPAIRDMMSLVRHRGPDDEGYAFLSGPTAQYAFVGGADTPQECFTAALPYSPTGHIQKTDRSSARIALGHRRLSIIDLSPAGHQPMCTADGKFAIIYNGEIYNHLELRSDLEHLGHRFLTHSDTEVILHAYREWDRDCLRRFNGMFAFIIIDRQRGRLFATRDRFGVKPLYYWHSPKGFLAFASEIKQFTVLPGWNAVMNGQRVYDYLNWGLSDHTEETCFAGVSQLRGGEYIDEPLERLTRTFPVQRWYQLAPEPFQGSLDEAALRLNELFTDSVRLRMRSDVPIGTGLSGGLDSSSIVCTVNTLLRAQDAHALQKTFSSCSEVKRFDERDFIDIVVKHTGVDARYIYPSLPDLFTQLPMITWHQDEPFLSTSIYAEWSIFQLVRSAGVKVTLDGHGSDELLAGYHSFFAPHFAGLLRSFRLLKLAHELSAARRIHGYTFARAARMMIKMILPEIINQPLKRVVGSSATDSPWLNLSLLGAQDRDSFSHSGMKTTSVNYYSRVQLTSTSLPVQLHWCDRDSMAHSIESRAPFLDYRVVEFISSLPPEYKLSNGTTKLVLRHAMLGVLPEAIRMRMDKMGFVTPEEMWIRETDPMLFRNSVIHAVNRSEGLINPVVIHDVDRFLAGQAVPALSIWRLINFAAWMERFSVKLPMGA